MREGGLRTILYSPSKTLFAFCSLFLSGVVLESMRDGAISVGQLPLLFFGGLVVVGVGWRHKLLRFFVGGMVCFVLGLLLTRQSLRIPYEEQHVAAWNEHKVELRGVVTDDPDVRVSGVQYIIRAEEIQAENTHEAVFGRVLVRTNRYPRFAYGDRLSITCALKTPQPIEGFRYDRYLAKSEIFSVCSFPSITRVDGNNGHWFFQNIFRLKKRVASTIAALWSEPGASLMGGLLYGYRGGLGSLDATFRNVGLSHIVAVSGQNISFILGALLPILFWCGLRRRLSAVFAIVFIGVFVLFAGASASVVRAGIMGGLVLCSRMLGRGRWFANLLMVTACTIVALHPLSLLYDTGFQLSFAATIGIVYLGGSMEKFFIRVPEFFGIREALSTTVAATLWTLPLSLFVFGSVSVVGVLANIVVVPLIPHLMIMGALAIAVALVCTPLGIFFASMPYLFMRYIALAASFLGSFSFVSVGVQISLFTVLGAYFILSWLTFRAYTKQQI